MMKLLLGSLLMIFLAGSCKMQELYLDVLQPAEVTLPPHIRNAGILDRSDPADATKPLDAIDKVISLEGANLDKEGASAAIAGVTDELRKNDRFTEVRVVDGEKIQAPGIGIFPAPLSREKITEICVANKVDAIFSLEMFDTDTKVSYSIKKGEGKNLLGVILTSEQQADMYTAVKTGWRIYDPSSGNILDEIAIARDLNFSATGLTPVIAANALIDRKEAVKKVGTMAGEAFAMRILPYRLRVSRDYYVKGNDNFRIAMRKARTGNWDEAGDIWMKETENSDPKIAGRACYNMAIISEINGYLDTATDWARKAYEDYNTRPALDYIDILENRKSNQGLLDYQQKR